MTEVSQFTYWLSNWEGQVWSWLQEPIHGVTIPLSLILIFTSLLATFFPLTGGFPFMARWLGWWGRKVTGNSKLYHVNLTALEKRASCSLLQTRGGL